MVSARKLNSQQYLDFLQMSLQFDSLGDSGKSQVKLNLMSYKHFGSPDLARGFSLLPDCLSMIFDDSNSAICH